MRVANTLRKMDARTAVKLSAISSWEADVELVLFAPSRKETEKEVAWQPSYSLVAVRVRGGVLGVEKMRRLTVYPLSSGVATSGSCGKDPESG